MNELYIMEPISNAPSLAEQTFDIFIVAACGDARAYRSASSLLKNGVRIESLVVLEYDSQKVCEGQTRFEKYCGFERIDLPKIRVEVHDNNLILDHAFFAGKRILVDITGFSIPNLLKLLFVLREIIGVHDFHMVYTEPKFYVFEEDTFGSYKYLIGEREYRALDEYYVSGTDNRELLIIFLGFDRMTSSIVKDAVDPTEIILVNGFPALTPKLKDVSLLNNRELVAATGYPAYCVKTNNPFSTYNVLSTIRSKNPELLINICVLGTKAMALGAGVFALLNKGIKLSYAFSKETAPVISSGINESWYYYFKV